MFYSVEDFYKILDFYFANNKFQTANRKFFENIESLLDNDKQFSYPWTISWQLTSKCNLRCRHCFFEGNEDFYNGENNLSTEYLLNLADELINLNIVAVSLSGGETLLRKDLFLLLEKLKSNNIAISLQTNATLINKNIINKLNEILNPYTDYVQVSLDGANKETFEKIRGENTFHKVVTNIKELINAGINVNINSTINKINYKELSAIYLLVNNLGVKKLSLSSFIPCNSNHTNLEIDFSSTIKDLSKTIELAKSGNTFLELNYKFYNFTETPQLRDLLDKYLKSNNKETKSIKNISCHKHNTLLINADGEVYLCYNCSCKDGLLGKYPNLSMQEIWNNRKENIFFQPRLAKYSSCKTCKYFYYCKGGCMGNAYTKYNSIYEKDFLCKYNNKFK